MHAVTPTGMSVQYQSDRRWEISETID